MVLFIVRFRVRLLSSRAMAKPKIVINRAINFRYQGIVREVEHERTR